MKTKIIFENQNDCAKDKSKEFEGQYMKAILLALLGPLPFSSSLHPARLNAAIKHAAHKIFFIIYLIKKG